MDIKRLCYELYKIDWKRSHGISDYIEMDYIKDYYENFANTEYTYDDYLDEFGYDGIIYVCYEEFCDVEYCDKKYMRELLKNENLIKQYYADIREQ